MHVICNIRFPIRVNGSESNTGTKRNALIPVGETHAIASGRRLRFRMARMGHIFKSPIDAIIYKMLNNSINRAPLLVLACLFAANSLILSQTQPASASKPSAPVPQSSGGVSHSRYRPSHIPKRAVEYYSLVWGVDSLAVKWTESGEVIRFSYRVLDADKAKALNDKKNQPVLNDPQAGVQLVVPSLEKVGQLRQSSPPEAGKSYWMAFSNKGRPVKRGDRVIVEIGTFKAEGLIVE